MYDDRSDFTQVTSITTPVILHGVASPESLLPELLAHLNRGVDVPDLHEGVVPPAHDARPVRRESDGAHAARVSCERAHLGFRCLRNLNLVDYFPEGSQAF